MRRHSTCRENTLTLLGCWLFALSGVTSAQTTFPEAMDPTRRDHYGQHYDPGKYMECLSKIRGADTRCEFLRLRRLEQPEYWPYSNTPRPTLPEAPKELVYRKGMTSKEYFDALCKAEAGEFVYRSVENVEGIYQIRPRIPEVSDARQQDRYVMEDPFGHGFPERDSARDVGFLLSGPGRFRFVETPIPPLPEGTHPDRTVFDESFFRRDPRPGVIYRQHGYDGKTYKSLRVSIDERPIAEYGFTWRGIKRFQDRELSIAGGELIILRLRDNEILGVRRGFARSGFANTRDRIFWGNAETCPQLPAGASSARPFILRVLKPRPFATNAKS